ncbi:hypothetical protein LIER_32916 [Lithospermum erythrorhizon]|uniref:Uncharacterized protein n=1 Tax=Lithospermum erythrorhizon TaxID=34254 RepID=A0AAV3RV96_LITER
MRCTHDKEIQYEFVGKYRLSQHQAGKQQTSTLEPGRASPSHVSLAQLLPAPTFLSSGLHTAALRSDPQRSPSGEKASIEPRKYYQEGQLMMQIGKITQAYLRENLERLHSTLFLLQYHLRRLPLDPVAYTGPDRRGSCAESSLYLLCNSKCREERWT